MTEIPYPTYAASGVEWLGDVPAHWPVMRMAALFSEISEEGDESLPILSVSIHDGVSDKELEADEMDRKVTRSDDRSKYKRVAPGDLVYNMMRAWQGSFGAVQTSGMVSPAYVVARPRRNLSTSFIEHLLRTPVAVEEMRRRSRGVTDFRLRLYWEEFKGIQIAVPPPSEQTAITTFLERETGKIDALVGEQKRLIELLNEKRQAVISHTVTKGLNPDAPMRDTGIEWLGKVPEHWEVAPLKRYWSVTDCKHITAEFVDEGYPLASIRECQERFVDLSVAKQTTDEFYEVLVEGGRTPQSGDLIFTRNATVGRVSQVADWHPPFAMGQDVCLLRRNDVLQSADYLQFAMEATSTVQQLEVRMIGSTFKRVNVQEIRNLLVAFAPVAEQGQIASYLQHHTTKLDDLISAAESTVFLLQERRAALISAAVTGKIDVRGPVQTQEAAE